jgi:hypothetical protein
MSCLAPFLARSIHLVRGHKVLLDEDLAKLYEVETKRLNEAVKRNVTRFPSDFAFRLTPEEAADLKSQSATSSGHGGRRRSLPMAFTEQGVAMLSSVLGSERAIAVNIEIMRAFVRLRHILAEHADLAQRLAALESALAQRCAAVEASTQQTAQALDEQAQHIQVIFEALQRLMATDDTVDGRVGFDLG